MTRWHPGRPLLPTTPPPPKRPFPGLAGRLDAETSNPGAEMLRERLMDEVARMRRATYEKAARQLAELRAQGIDVTCELVNERVETDRERDRWAMRMSADLKIRTVRLADE